MLSQIVLIFVTPIIALILRMAISREREYFADKEAVAICNEPNGLINALKKLETYSAMHPLIGDYSNQATANLFIVNPFKKSIITNLFSTHPPLNERIKRLESY